MTTSGRASVLIFTCRGPRHHALINALARSHDVRGIVFEKQFRLRLKLLGRRFFKLGVLTVLNQLLFKLLDVLFFQVDENCKAARMLGQEAVFDQSSFPNATILETGSINSAPVVSLVEQLKPDLVVVSGTSLLGKELLGLLGSTPVINIHCGITPRYRGTHGAYWAVVNGDWENVGTTVHFIDSGVDTGAIIGQTTIQLEPDDSPRVLALKQYCSGIPLISEAVSNIRAGNLTTASRNDLDSRFYSSPTLTSYLIFKKRMRERFAKPEANQDS
jgi:methionyl-tRNA formyltransferase